MNGAQQQQPLITNTDQLERQNIPSSTATENTDFHANDFNSTLQVTYETQCKG